MREAFGHAGGLHLSEPAVLGVLSLVFWSLILVVTAEVRRADPARRQPRRGRGAGARHAGLARRARHAGALCWLIPALTIAGLALFYGDGLITPAISVLSAVEGLETAAPALEPYVVPIAALVLLGLFLLQSRGTASVGSALRPGDAGLVRDPRAARPRPDRAEPGRARGPRPALRPGPVRAWPAGRPSWRWVRSCSRSPGRRRSTPTWAISAAAPIRLAWFGLVLPGLVLNYFGQGALVLRDPAALEHPFYHLVPGLGAVAADRARHLRHHHRQPSGDLGRVLAHPAGDPARLPAADDGQAHLAPPRSARSTSRA